MIDKKLKKKIESDMKEKFGEGIMEWDTFETFDEDGNAIEKEKEAPKIVDYQGEEWFGCKHINTHGMRVLSEETGEYVTMEDCEEHPSGEIPMGPFLHLPINERNVSWGGEISLYIDVEKGIIGWTNPDGEDVLFNLKTKKNVVGICVDDKRKKEVMQ